MSRKSESIEIQVPEHIGRAIKAEMAKERSYFSCEVDAVTTDLMTIALWVPNVSAFNHLCRQKFAEFDAKLIKARLLEKLAQKAKRARVKWKVDMFGRIAEEVADDVDPYEKWGKLMNDRPLGKSVAPAAVLAFTPHPRKP